MVFYPDISLHAQERLALSDWVESNAGKPFFRDANMGGKRATTRYTPSAEFTFPNEAYLVQNKVAAALGFSVEPATGFKDGMVASHASPGDTCYAHKDPRWHRCFYTVHCNVILSAPEEGGELVVEGKQYNMPEGSFICYPVSEVMHETLLVKGTKPRLMWVFGFCVPPEQYLETVRKYQ
jgi:hypothetical protein